MSQVTSQDGTSISYDRQGNGPAVILVGGGLDDGSENAPLAAELAEHFTVINYARRGRGDSGDTLPYAVEREIEDLDVLISEAGGSAHVYGVSSGGALAMAAAAAGSAINKLAAYEVPYGWPSAGFIETLDGLLAEDRGGDAVALFMRSAGSSDDEVAGARSLPFWPALEALAATLAYDAACMRAIEPPSERLARITQPTLVLTGAQRANTREGMGGLASDFFDRAGDAIAASIPGAQRQALPGQGHVADPNVAGPVLEQFFGH